MENQNKKFYSQGLRFECQRCSFCCGKTPGFVYLSRTDLLRLCEHFNLGVKEFTEKYCRWADYYYGATVLALFEEKNCDCVLWNQGCSAYEARPVQCRTYPFWSWIVADSQTWNDCAKDCPGMNNGKLWNQEYIAQNAQAYEENKPITKEEVLALIEEEKLCSH